MTTDTAPSPHGRRLYVAAFVCSALTALVAVAFFFIGLADGSISSFNLALWLGLLATLGLSLWAGHALRAQGRSGLALAALSVTAVPGILGGLFVLLLLVMQPRWN